MLGAARPTLSPLPAALLRLRKPGQSNTHGILSPQPSPTLQDNTRKQPQETRTSTASPAASFSRSDTMLADGEGHNRGTISPVSWSAFSLRDTFGQPFEQGDGEGQSTAVNT